MSDEDRIAALVALAVGGAEFADEELAPLLQSMTAAELAVAGRRLGAEYVKTLPPLPTGSAAPNVTELDSADVYLEIVKRGARPEDPRLAILAELMTGEELGRAMAGVSELWLRAEARPARPN